MLAHRLIPAAMPLCRSAGVKERSPLFTFLTVRSGNFMLISTEGAGWGFRLKGKAGSGARRLLEFRGGCYTEAESAAGFCSSVPFILLLTEPDLSTGTIQGLL